MSAPPATLPQSLPKPPVALEPFPCFHCGYDLRGHYGRVRRCPECGAHTSRAMLEALRNPTRRFVPDFPVLPIVPALIFASGAYLSIAPFGLEAVLVAFGVSWLVSLTLFLVRYRCVDDRLWLLFESHVVCVGLVPAFFMVPIALCVLLLEPKWLILLWLACSVATLLTTLLCYRRMCRRLPRYAQR